MILNDRKIDIMGIVNLTDNSYFAESRCLNAEGNADADAVVKKVGLMIEEGATIIDIGACSTRPGSEPVGKEEEWRRLEPVLKAVRNEFPEIEISIDTYRAAVAAMAYMEIGNFTVNDISAGEDDPAMLPTVGRLGLKYVAMHKRGTPKTMQSLCDYDNVTEDVLEYFRKFKVRADAAGVRNWILDPGFGFAKTIEQNYEMLRNLDRFTDTGRKVLVGVSRKSMIYRMFGTTPEESLPETQVLHLKALQLGADILRVHDVRAARHTVELYRLLG